MARSLVEKVFSRVGAVLGQSRRPKRLAWADAQKYEFENAKQFMESEPFKQALSSVNDSTRLVSTGYVDPLMLKEFFSGEREEWLKFVRHITGKVVVEIGPAVATQLALWDVARRRVVIEPLYNLVYEHQRMHYGMTGFENVEAVSEPAETRIDGLVGEVDGALLVRNCLDHTPSWPFVLSNIADYMKPGAELLLWNDLTHPEEYLDGHYDITDDPASYRRLIENLGFSIVSEYQELGSACINYGCRAIRK